MPVTPLIRVSLLATYERTNVQNVRKKTVRLVNKRTGTDRRDLQDAYESELQRYTAAGRSGVCSPRNILQINFKLHDDSGGSRGRGHAPAPPPLASVMSL